MLFLTVSRFHKMNVSCFITKAILHAVPNRVCKFPSVGSIEEGESRRCHSVGGGVGRIALLVALPSALQGARLWLCRYCCR
jgi:hypothetical protein